MPGASIARPLICALAHVLGLSVAVVVPAQSAAPLPVKELTELTSDLPPDIREGILERPRAFLGLAEELLRVPPELLVIVDKQHPLDPGYTPADLVPASDYPELTANAGVLLRNVLMHDLLSMVRAAAREGITLPLSSTYRSYATQRVLYDGVVEKRGKEAADRVSAQPGKSQHQLGTTIDFGSITDAFAATAAGKWLALHAWEYGFSLSYPEGQEAFTGYRYESWHYRYITREGARMQHVFFGDLQQSLLVFLHEHRPQLARVVSP